MSTVFFLILLLCTFLYISGAINWSRKVSLRSNIPHHKHDKRLLTWTLYSYRIYGAKYRHVKITIQFNELWYQCHSHRKFALIILSIYYTPTLYINGVLLKNHFFTLVNTWGYILLHSNMYTTYLAFYLFDFLTVYKFLTSLLYNSMSCSSGGCINYCVNYFKN